MTLGDVVSLQRGTTYKSSLLDQPGPVLLGLASIGRDGGFRSDSLRTYGGDSPEKLILGPGDLYVSLKDVTQSGDLLGAVSRVPPGIAVGRLTQDTVKLSLIRGDVQPEYVYWLLRTPHYRSYCRARAIGTTNLSLARDDFLAFHVPEPTPARLAVVDVLEDVDDKIELNRRMNETLEALFSTIVLGSHKGEPIRFGDLAENRRDIVNPTDMEPGTPYIALEHMPRRSIALTEWGDASSVSSAKSRVRRGDILFGKLRPYFHKVGIAPCDGVCSTDILVIRPKSPDLHPLTLAVASSDAFVAHATATSTGTKMPRASWRDLAGYEFHAPDRERLSELNPIAASLLERIAVNIRESRTLAALRDALLPKLISGELRIRDAERTVEAAT